MNAINYDGFKYVFTYESIIFFVFDMIDFGFMDDDFVVFIIDCWNVGNADEQWK